MYATGRGSYRFITGRKNLSLWISIADAYFDKKKARGNDSIRDPSALSLPGPGSY